MALDLLIQEAQNMSENSLNEVLRFMRFLKKEEQNAIEVIEQTSKEKRTGGWLSGTVIMAPDFDAPLEDFKEYM